MVSVFPLIQDPVALFILLQNVEQNWRRLSIDSKIPQCASSLMIQNYYEILVIDFHTR